MTVIDDFIYKAIKQDNRNIIQRSSKSISCQIIAPFYDKYEPIDLEVIFHDLTAIRFYPSTKFKSLSEDYAFNNSNIIVFASWEGDPIYAHDDKIFIAPHGVGEYTPEKDFYSLENFLKWVSENMK